MAEQEKKGFVLVGIIGIIGIIGLFELLEAAVIV